MQNHTSGPAGIRLGNCVYVGGYFYGGILYEGREFPWRGEGVFSCNIL